MPRIEITAFVRQGRKKFWHGNNPSATGAALKARSGKSPSVVAVRDDRRKDYRLKVWLTAEVDSLVSAMFQVAVSGGAAEEVRLANIGGGRYQGSVKPEVLERLGVSGPPAPRPKRKPSKQSLYLRALDQITDAGDPAGPFADVCVETRFAPSDQPWKGWQAPLTGLPDWVGTAEAFSCSPPVTGGGWHSLDMRLDLAAGKLMLARNLRWWRVNGVWVEWSPVAESDSTGWSEFKGRFSGVCDPEDLEAIRSYGEDGIAQQPNEPMPPRDRIMLRALDRRRAIPGREYMAWGEDLKVWRNSVMGMAAGQGQVDVHGSILARSRARVAALERFMVRTRLPESDPYRRSKAAELVSAHQSVASRKSGREELAERVAAHRVTAEATLARIEEREARYADIIPALTPAP